MVFRLQADDGPFIAVLGSSIPSSTKKKKKKKTWSNLDPLLQNSLDPRMFIIVKALIKHACTTIQWYRRFQFSCHSSSTSVLRVCEELWIWQHCTDCWLILYIYNSKTCLKQPLKKGDQRLVFKTNYRLMQVKSIAECSNTFYLH